MLFTDIPWTRFNVEIFIRKARTIMKALRSVFLSSVLLAVGCGVPFVQNSTVRLDLTRVAAQAKTIYLFSGHVKYFKTKGFRTRLVDGSPFEEPSHKELEKSGSGVIILDVVHPGSKQILWYTSKNVGLSWSTNTAVAGLFKNLREYVESQERAARPATPATAPNAVQPVAAKSEQH
jgi:hypothetical protein